MANCIKPLENLGECPVGLTVNVETFQNLVTQINALNEVVRALIQNGSVTGSVTLTPTNVSITKNADGQTVVTFG